MKKFWSILFGFFGFHYESKRLPPKKIEDEEIKVEEIKKELSFEEVIEKTFSTVSEQFRQEQSGRKMQSIKEKMEADKKRKEIIQGDYFVKALKKGISEYFTERQFIWIQPCDVEMKDRSSEFDIFIEEFGKVCSAKNIKHSVYKSGSTDWFQFDRGSLANFLEQISNEKPVRPSISDGSPYR